MRFHGYCALLWAGVILGTGRLPPGQRHSVVPGSATAQVHVGKGYQDIESRRYAEAARQFQAALSINPHLPEVRYQLAICEFAMGRLEDATKEFNRLSQDAPGNPDVVYYLGRIDLQEGDFSAAVRKFSIILSSPPFPDTLYYLGSAYLREGKLADAERWLRQAARLNPRDFRVADHLARVYQRQRRTAEAEKEYALSAQLRHYYDEGAREVIACDRSLETLPLDRPRTACQQLLDSHDPDKLTILGIVYGRHGDYKDALPPLEVAARRDPDSWAVQHNLGLTYFRLRRYSDALPPLRRAVDLRPEFFGSSALLGATLYALGVDEQAYLVMVHAHLLNPSDSDTAQLLFNESLVLARRRYLKKNYPKCLEYLHEAATLCPDDAETRRRIIEVEKLLAKCDLKGRSRVQ